MLTQEGAEVLLEVLRRMVVGGDERHQTPAQRAAASEHDDDDVAYNFTHLSVLVVQPQAVYK